MERDYDPGAASAASSPARRRSSSSPRSRRASQLTAEAGIERLREKSIALSELMSRSHDAWLAPLGFELGSPRDRRAAARTCRSRHEEAWPISRALIERAASSPDFRGPDLIRLGVAPLYTRYMDVWDALDRLRGVVDARRAASSTRRRAASERPEART